MMVQKLYARLNIKKFMFFTSVIKVWEGQEQLNALK